VSHSFYEGKLSGRNIWNDLYFGLAAALKGRGAMRATAANCTQAAAKAGQRGAALPSMGRAVVALAALLQRDFERPQQ
jgi:hypothetical protein